MKIVAVLDNIRSLYNVGSIFRTADAFGISTLYLCGITGKPDNELTKKRINKTALGAEETVKWKYLNKTIGVIQKLKKEGYLIIALEQTTKSIDIRDLGARIKKMVKTKKVALIVGHELFGVTSDVLGESDIITHIPMEGNKESLNVSVAFGIGASWIKWNW